jgi:hypothetical protein
MKNFIFCLTLSLTLSGCSHYTRNIASVGLTPPDLKDLKEASQLIIDDVERADFPSYCVSYLRDLEKSIDRLDVTKLPKDKLIADASEITANSWTIRKTLHSRLSEFNKACTIQAQATFRSFRFIEDYLGELKNKVVHNVPADIDFQNQPVPLKADNISYYGQKFSGDRQFKSGDMFITRGVSFLSGMIARLGDRPTQFSHIVMLYEDPKTGEMKSIESYVGVGVQFYGMDFALKNENARILWLRAKDHKLAEDAAMLMGALVQERLDKKMPIKYDYALDFNNADTMSCAEVSQVAFKMASGNQFKIPYYQNNISGPDEIVNRLGLLKGETYEPGDMEIDPRFELMGEFQDLRLTRDSRQKDAIMTAVFDWLEKKNYVLKDNMKSKMAGGIIYDVRRTFMWPLVKKMLKLSDFSKEIPRNMVRTTALINQLGEVMLTELKKRDEAFEKEHGVPMSYMDFYKALEEMRVEDLKRYQNKKKEALFHKFIRPE